MHVWIGTLSRMASRRLQHEIASTRSAGVLELGIFMMRSVNCVLLISRAFSFAQRPGCLGSDGFQVMCDHLCTSCFLYYVVHGVLILLLSSMGLMI